MIDFDCDIYVDKCAKYTFTLHIVPSVHSAICVEGDFFLFVVYRQLLSQSS